jgi:NAD(P)-dependent dehydrogenase (short-subunit alcohol dehydrogenase family)
VTNSEIAQRTDLAGQVGIVTGGGRGIGRAIAQALAGHGASVAVVARTEPELAETVRLISQAGGRAVAHRADVTDQDAVEEMVAGVEHNLGPVALLVNSAGLLGPGGPVWQVDPAEWWRCIDVNLRGPFLCARAVLSGMVDRGRGRIITVVSSAGTEPWPCGTSYAIGKSAALFLSENLACETADHGISAFAVHPGFVRTSMTEDAAQRPCDAEWWGGIFRTSLAEGRPFTPEPPERAGELAVILASGYADALSGCLISVGDDVAEMVSQAQEIERDQKYRLRLRT